MRSPSSHRSLSALFLALLLGGSFPVAARAETLVHDKDRIVFCGDSITGQGGNGGAGGWVGHIGEGLALAHPDQHQTLTALGGSGATVGAWQNIEKKSRDNPVFLDVKTADVKATLDGGAEIVVIMLGMNDVLSPGVKDQPADFDAWAVRYHDLIEAIKARAHPRLIALATITPCTEDPDSPKNRVEGELNTRLAALAKQENGVVLPTHEAMLEILARGRGFNPDFHVTADYVHPRPEGHLAIAVGMLRGLGEGEAAQQLIDKYSALLTPKAADLPTLSYTLKPQPGSPDEAKQHFTVHYRWTPPASSTADPAVTATLPDGWNVTPSSLTGAQGDFQVSGPLDHIANTITLHGATGDLKRDTEIDIPAGWRIAVGGSKCLGWSLNSIYDPVKDHTPLDDLLAQDGAFLAPQTFPTGDTPPWKLYLSSIDFTGRGAPGSVDMAAVTFFKNRDLAYGARWIYSEKDRPVDVTVGTQAFASMAAVCVFLNADTLYQGIILKAPGRKVTAEGKLHRGWNRLLFKTTFIQWQWQFSVDMAGKPGDDLADVRYATAPPAATSGAPVSVPAPTPAPATTSAPPLKNSD